MSPLAADHSQLPKAAKPDANGNAPDPEPTFLRPYFDALIERNATESERPHAIEGTRFRHSMAGDCARAIAYHDLGVPASNPMDLAGMYVTGNGTMKHDEIQAVLVERVPGFTPEVPCQVEDLDGSGSADGRLLVEGYDNLDGPDDGETPYAGVPDQVVCWEHKNVGGFAFKMAIGERGDAQGPKFSHKVQGALNAIGMNADVLVITYLTWEAVSVNIAKRKGFSEEGRIAAQWTYQRDEFVQWVTDEAKRVSGILALVDDGILPARRFADPELPKGAEIVNPSNGTWRVTDADGKIVDTGSWWACGYCRWQDVCSDTPAGRAPISEVAVTLGIAERGAA